MSDFGTSSEVALTALAVGDIIYTKVLINKADMANPNATSGTAKSWGHPVVVLTSPNWNPIYNRIKRGHPVERYCVVLAVGTQSITVTYLATFNRAKKLPTTLDEAYWYPIDPAEKEAALDPLPALNTNAQWASLRTKQTIAVTPVSCGLIISMNKNSIPIVVISRFRNTVLRLMPNLLP